MKLDMLVAGSSGSLGISLGLCMYSSFSFGVVSILLLSF